VTLKVSHVRTLFDFWDTDQNRQNGILKLAFSFLQVEKVRSEGSRILPTCLPNVKTLRKPNKSSRSLPTSYFTCMDTVVHEISKLWPIR
jgi:hypothetical protein